MYEKKYVVEGINVKPSIYDKGKQIIWNQVSSTEIKKKMPPFLIYK